MPKGPVSIPRAKTLFGFLFSGHRVTLKELDDGQCVAWMDNKPEASYAGQSWEEVLRLAVRDSFKDPS